MIVILFKDYTETKILYHVVTITDLEKTLKYGIQYDDKRTYKSKYQEFHNYFDDRRLENIPGWVLRSKSIFASINFKEQHVWHSHSALLGLKIQEDRCWVCNENIANYLYEPLMLSQVDGFEDARDFMGRNGSRIAKDYWHDSLSFKENLIQRRDKKTGYDAEVLILHDILPKDIELLYIASDHRCMEVNKWKKFFQENNLNYTNC